MWFQVDPRSSIPIYQQVIDGVKQSVAKAIVSPGDKLPSVRECASSMMLNPNTVAKAYQELERLGIIEVVRGRGTYVAQPTTPINREKRLSELRHSIKRLLIEAHHLQLDDDQLLDLFHQSMSEWHEEKGRHVL